MMRASRRYLALGAFALLVTVWAVALRPQSLGGTATYVVVRGNSMQPTYATGDLVIMRSAPAYSVHDVVAYHVPQGEVGEGLVVVHRIVGGDETHGFTLKGDNNRSIDPWTPQRPDVLGRAWVHIPGLGRVIALMYQPVAMAAMAAAIIVVLLLMRVPTTDPEGRHDPIETAQPSSRL